MNNMQKVYVSDEEKEKIMDKLNRDTEVREALLFVGDFCVSCLWCVIISLTAVSCTYEDHGLQPAARYPRCRKSRDGGGGGGDRAVR